jgi:nitrogen fixation NifU-like protein
MDRYSEKYLAHFQSPQNLGEVENPSAVAEVQYKGQGCFDRISMSIKIENNQAKDIKYRVRGCSGTIAACSTLTTLVMGKSIDEVKQITKENLILALGGIPEQKQHSVDLALEALHKLLDSFPV